MFSTAFSLSNLSILTKTMLVIGLLSATTIVVAVSSASSLRKLDLALERIHGVSSAAALTPRITVNLTAMSRGEMRVAANPTAEEISAVRALNDKEHNEAQERIKKLKPLLTEEDLPLMTQLESELVIYLDSMNATLAAAEKVGGDINVEASQMKILEAAKASRLNAEKLRTIMRDMGNKFAAQADAVLDHSHATYQTMRHTLIAISSVGVLGGILVGFFIAQIGISRPLRALVAVLQKLASGELETGVPGAVRTDEIGEIARTTLVFKENMVRTRSLEAEAAEQARIAASEKRAALNSMANTFEAGVKGIVQSVSSAATQLQGNAENMTNIAEETSRQAIGVATTTEEASGNVQTVAAAAEELTSSIGEISRRVAESAKIAQAAVEEVTRTNAGIAGLAKASERIGSVLKIISDIAGQTNLLALNATIEAARAGDAGKGFAVVAAEVKNLATQTARATEEISDQINSIQTESGAAVQAIQSIGDTVGRINEISAGIAAAVEEQSAATQEIARNVQQAAAGTEAVSRNIGGVNQSATEAGKAAAEVLKAAGALRHQSVVLSQQVDDFVEQVRAG